MYYRQPRYFNDFQCIGSECIENCCYGWRIDWSKDEVDKVKNAPNISRELFELVESTFVPGGRNDMLKVKFDEHGDCPFHGEDGLCRIQKELGAEYLSYTCTFYPRIVIQTETSGEFYRLCATSCPEILKKLLNDERAMDILTVPKNDKAVRVTVSTTEEKREVHPELNYRGQLLEFFYELISDKKIPLETAIILGALVAQKLTALVEGGKYDSIPDALKAFRKQFHNRSQLEKIENIEPNYYLKFGFLSEIIEKVIENGAMALLHDETGTLNIDMYNIGEANLKKALEGREFFLRDLALNLLFEFAVPFKLENKTIFENYSLFVAAFAMLKLNMIAVCSTELGITMRLLGQKFVYKGDNKLVGMTAILCRGICQSESKANTVLKLMNDNRFTTPAYLALLVK